MNKIEPMAADGNGPEDHTTQPLGSVDQAARLQSGKASTSRRSARRSLSRRFSSTRTPHSIMASPSAGSRGVGAGLPVVSGLPRPRSTAFR